MPHFTTKKRKQSGEQCFYYFETFALWGYVLRYRTYTVNMLICLYSIKTYHSLRKSLISAICYLIQSGSSNLSFTKASPQSELTGAVRQHCGWNLWNENCVNSDAHLGEPGHYNLTQGQISNGPGSSVGRVSAPGNVRIRVQSRSATYESV